jgi:hypothetical protein
MEAEFVFRPKLDLQAGCSEGPDGVHSAGYSTPQASRVAPSDLTHYDFPYPRIYPAIGHEAMTPRDV